MNASLRVLVPLMGTDQGRSGIGHYVSSVLPILSEELERAGGTLILAGSKADLDAYSGSTSALPIETVVVPDMSAAMEAAWHLLRLGPIAKHAHADCILMLAGNRRLVASSDLPTVAVVHDLAQWNVAGKYDALRTFYVRRVLRHFMAKTRRLVAVSRATSDHMQQVLDIEENSVSVVHNGIDHSRFQPAGIGDAEVLQKLEIDRPYILYPSRLEHPGKNHHRLIQAFAQSDRLRSAKLVLAGKDWGAGDMLRHLCRDLGVSDRVRFLGYVEDAHLPALVRQAHAVTMVGLCEGFGLPAVESLASGTPVLASNTGSLPEVTGGLAVMCDPYDVESIRGGLENAALCPMARRRSQMRGPGWASRFSWKATGTELVAICQEACQ
jgi:glycosyltransferase involved in cell wall biosynthesis